MVSFLHFHPGKEQMYMKHGRSSAILIGPSDGRLDAETAIELIETVIQLYRDSLTVESAAEVPSNGHATLPVVRASDRITESVVAATPRRSRAALRTSDNPETSSSDEPLSAASGRGRKVYMLDVHDGRTLNAKTPAAVKVADFIRRHPKQPLDAIVSGTQLRHSTVANILSDFNKQRVLRSEAIPAAH